MIGAKVFLLLILSLALVVRLWGIGFGLPETHHWDEFTDLLNALQAARDGGRLLNYAGGSLIPYLLLPLYGGFSLWSALAAQMGSPQTLDLTETLLPARILVSLLSGVTILVTYLAAKALFPGPSGQRIGLMAALFLAIAPLSVQEAHYARGHSLAAFFVVVTLYFCVRLASQPLLRYYLLAGLSLGIAVAAEYYAATAALLILLAHYLALRGERVPLSPKTSLFHRPLLLSGSLAVAAFLALTPAALLDAPFFLSWLRWYTGENTGWWVDPEGMPIWFFYLGEHLRYGLGEPILIAALAGLALLLYKRHPATLFVLLFPVVFLILLDRGPNFARYALPLLPFLSMAAAAFIEFGFALLPLPKLWRPGVLGVLLLLFLLPSSLDVLRFDYLITQKDTRSYAREWLERNITPGSLIVVEGGHGSGLRPILGPELARSPQQLEVLRQEATSSSLIAYLEVLGATGRVRPAYQVYYPMRLESIAFEQYAVVPYLVSSSWALHRTPRDPRYERMLREEYVLLAEFAPNPPFRFDLYAWRMDYQALRQISPWGGDLILGPTLRVYARRDSLV